MFDPEIRSFYMGAVRPPPGYVFDQALATTYSLDLATLLSLPIHLALAEAPSSAEVDPIKILESLRRLTDRFSVYVDHAGIIPPSMNHLLYGLLEQVVTPVKAVRGGVFHPKIWVLRFIRPEISEPPLIRLLILSRNITFDRSWDIALQLEGQPGGRNVAANRPLANFIKLLPSMSTQHITDYKKVQAQNLAEEVRKTVWELPEGFENISFHVLGIDEYSWTPSRSKRMVVISPFIKDHALSWLSNHTEDFVAVISRPDQLSKLSSDTMQIANKWYTLDEAAETEEGENQDQIDTAGLHAKIYVLEKGWRTTLYLGSANATNAALINRNNIEILVELVGKTSRVGGIDTLFDKKGLGSVLSEYFRSEEEQPLEDEESLARKALEAARNKLSESNLKIVCKKYEDSWELKIVSPKRVVLPGISKIKAWPITVSEKRASDVTGLMKSRHVDLGRFSTESVVGLIAFELVSDIKKKSLRIVLKLPVDGLPENRDDAIFKHILENREGFLRYISLLLGDYTVGFGGKKGLFDSGKGSGIWNAGFSNNIPILEELARTLSRYPDKLKDITAVINRLKDDSETSSIVPKKFLELWSIFEAAMKETDT